jgi:arylsulfatase A-like enzyme
VSSLDLVPTFLSLAGERPPKDAVLDGIDVSGYWAGTVKRLPDRMLFFRMGGGGGKDGAKGGSRPYAVVHGNWKILSAAKGYQLYDLATDPGETRDLSGREPRRAETMYAAYQKWDREMDAYFGSFGDGP